jgi:hypothetical protein
MTMTENEIRSLIRTELAMSLASIEARLDDPSKALRFTGDFMAPGSMAAAPMPYRAVMPTVTWWTKKTGALQVTVTAGKMMLKGVSLSIASWPANGVVNLSDNATTWAWLAVNLSAATATWTTGSSDPGDGTDTAEPIRIFKVVTASGVITELLICQDFRLPGNA